MVEHLTLNQVARGSSPRSRTIMVDVVQLVERQIVVLVVVGSNPIIHPIKLLGCRQAVRHHTLTVVCVGSNPALPAIFHGSLAQLVEHMTFNHVVRGSIPR